MCVRILLFPAVYVNESTLILDVVPENPSGLGSRLVLQREVRDIGPCLDGRALED